MNKIFEIASRVTTPLCLAGVFAAAFFLSARQILKRKTVRQIPRRIRFSLMDKISKRHFALALVSMCLGFFAYLFVQRSVNKSSETRSNSQKSGVPCIAGVSQVLFDPIGDFMAGKWAANRGEIEWVLLKDANAHRNYDEAVKRVGKYEAILYAQHKDRGLAADRIRLYGKERTERYITALGF